MPRLYVYARREPTTDAIAIKYGGSKKMYDVQVYRDRAMKKPYARFVYGNKKPDRRNKTVTLNCFIWNLIWLEDKKS